MLKKKIKWAHSVGVISFQAVLPSGQLDDVPWLDEAAQLVPNRDGNAPALVCHLAWADLMTVFRFGYST